jgi:iron complex transport system substrate-binding protein
MKNTLYAALFALLGAIAPALASADIKVTDVMGRERTLPQPAQRVLLGFYFEDFLAITGPNAYDRVVAINKSAWHDWRNSQWKTYSKAIPRIEKLIDVGGTESNAFSLEKAIAAKPDVAILSAWQIRSMGEMIDRLEAAGIPVIAADYNAQTVEKHVASTMTIGAVMGTMDRAHKLASEYKAAVEDVRSRVSKAVKAGATPKRVYVELGHKGPDEHDRTFGNGYMWGGMIDHAGGKNIANGVIERTAPINPEHVLAQNPEVILIPGSYWTNGDKAVLMGFGVSEEETKSRLKPYVNRSGWANLDAVKNNQIHAVYHGGARTLYDYAFLQYLGKVMYPKAFADIDPKETHRQFYERYLPIAANGSFVTGLDR